MGYGNARRYLEPIEGASVPQSWQGGDGMATRGWLRADDRADARRGASARWPPTVL